MPEPKRKRRITRACDQCHRSNTKCTASTRPSICQNCLDFGSECRYDRPTKRRGPRTKSDAETPPREGWYKELAPPDMILELVEAYHSIVYPIFPLFHWPTLLPRLQAQEYTYNRAFFCTTMTVCAIVSARFRNGVSTSGIAPLLGPPSESFAQAAKDAFPFNLMEAKGFEYMRAKALLAILYIQYGAVEEHRAHLGEYALMVSYNGLQDEKRWETGLNEPGKQERRRLFWSIYTLEVYSTITWGGFIRFREDQSDVQYPIEADDDYITDSGVLAEPHISYLRGWNYTTTMYRALEHLVGRLRRVRRSDTISELFSPSHSTSKTVLDRLLQMYAALPDSFKVARAMTGDIRQDRFGFQAANIAITLQTVKLVMAAAEDLGVEQRCAFLGELMNALAAIPTAYIAAISRPVLHHLASCGHLLAGVISRPLSQRGLLQVRSVLIGMTDLLCGLEIALDFPIEISAHLRTHVTKIDEHLARGGDDPLSQTLLALPLDHQLELQSDLTASWPLGQWDLDLGLAETGEDDFAWLLAPTNHNSPNPHV